MPQVSPDFTRSMVKALFVTTCLLSIVSWHTTEQGMALYLSVWFAVIASLGVQGALVFVAWLIGLAKSRRALLGAVYVITATVSIAFSYVSLYTWFSARERPAAVERKLYDELSSSVGKTQELLTAATAKHVIRAGYGLYYGQIFQNITLFMEQQANASLFSTVTYSNSVAPGTTSVLPSGELLQNFRFGIDPLPPQLPGGAHLPTGATGRPRRSDVSQSLQRAVERRV